MDFQRMPMLTRPGLGSTVGSSSGSSSRSQNILTGGLSGLLRRGGSGAPANSADQAFASLTREMWSNYLRDTVPLENRLISYSSDPGVVTNAMDEAGRDARRAFESRAAVAQRGLRAQGLTLDADERGVVDRTTSLSRSLADVNAQNVARDTTLARQQSILGNPSPAGGGSATPWAQGRG